MRKLSFLFILASSISVSLLAQETITASRRVIGLDTSGAIEERLVALAMKRPMYDVSVHNRATADHELSKAKNGWLNLLTISLNYNDQEFVSHSNNPYGQVYPKYYFGVTIPIGLFINRASDIKIARENQVIARDNQEELGRTIRAEVLTKYRAYVTYQELIAVQNIIINDEQAVFLQTEKNFRDGRTSIDLYNVASKNYNDEIIKKLTYKISSDGVKLELEQMLGTTLEEALK